MSHHRLVFNGFLAVYEQQDAVVSEEGQDSKEACPEQQARPFEGVGQCEDASAEEGDEYVCEGLVHTCTAVTDWTHPQHNVFRCWLLNDVAAALER